MNIKSFERKLKNNILKMTMGAVILASVFMAFSCNIMARDPQAFEYDGSSKYYFVYGTAISKWTTKSIMGVDGWTNFIAGDTVKGLKYSKAADTHAYIDGIEMNDNDSFSEAVISKLDGKNIYFCTNHSASAGSLCDKCKTTATVTFDVKGHGTAPTPLDIAKGSKASKPTDPTEAGYSFAGWYKNAALSGEWDFDSDTVTENITLYAKWISDGAAPASESSNSSSKEKKKHKKEKSEEKINEENEQSSGNKTSSSIPSKSADEKKMDVIIKDIIDAPAGEIKIIYLNDITALSLPVIKELKNKPNVILDMTYSYNGVEFNVVIPGGDSVLVDENIPWYGPIWLFLRYGGNAKRL